MRTWREVITIRLYLFKRSRELLEARLACRGALGGRADTTACERLLSSAVIGLGADPLYTRPEVWSGLPGAFAIDLCPDLAQRGILKAEGTLEVDARLKARRSLCSGVKKLVQMPVHLHLHAKSIDVVGIRAEGVFQLHGDEIQGPQNEYD